MLVLVITVPLLIWGLFMPLGAAACYLGLVVLFEGLMLADFKLRRPRLKDPTQVPTPEQMMFRRYHQFLRNPVGAVGCSKILSGIALASIPWAALLLWNAHWIIAAVVGANYFAAGTLASILNPLSALEDCAKRHPDALLQLTMLWSLYEERVAGAERGRTYKKREVKTIFPRVSRADFPALVEKLTRELEVEREQFVFAAVSTFKREGADVSGIPSVLELGSEFDLALQGFQLTSVIGVLWEHMDMVDWIPFDRALSESMAVGDVERMTVYRERYVSCQGDVEALSDYLAQDMLRLWGLPERAAGFYGGVRAGAQALIIRSQAWAAAACGDEKTSRKLNKRLGLA